ncbi:uncharacterized protein LOC109719467 isoform X2 [Ananas comosus]|uniref:Uncharacterized protein LOC109719467 isoform X2 n=1 Tax=Ananas comosus TaxID=4615 RepID=A0A6P5G7K1_ANACO|nr:uncharacterized protein LOC109719467 isoform X2 [Ananas comosus]
MVTLIPDVSRLLADTLSTEKSTVDSATEGLDRLSRVPLFPLSLLAVATGGESHGRRVAAATYLKNFTRRRMDKVPSSPELHREFRNQLAQALLQTEPAILKVLVEAFRLVISKDFVKENSWPELVPELKLVIQNSNLISQSEHSQWNTVNALTVLQTIIRPFQYFLNPKLPKEPVPPQLELIATDILAPLQVTFHHFVDKALSFEDKLQVEYDQILLIICKCMYFAVRSYMPSALIPILPPFCHDLFRIMNSLSLNGASSDDGYVMRLKTAKRSLIIFCSLVTRHRKHADKLMPSIVDCALKIAKQSANISKLDSLSERIVSLAFDVISHVLETGPGWRLVSSHFSSLLDSAIFPALTLNQKDISEWEEDHDEYMRKNLPSELDEISGWAEDLFTARKSAINLLGVIALSKGPPVVSAVSKRKKGDKSKGKQQQSSIGELLVIPFLSKFPIPSDGEDISSKTVQDYYGVLMAYGGLQDFLRERSSDYTTTLVRIRVLPLYSLHQCAPYLIASANWILGELVSCLPEAMSADIYNSLTKALSTPDIGDISCYPVRASAAGAISELLENDYFPPDWLSLLGVLVNRIGEGDENESSLLFHLLGAIVKSGEEKVAAHIPDIITSIAGAISKQLPPIPEPWPQVVERGFAALTVMAQALEDSMPSDETKQQEKRKWQSDQAAVARIVSALLQKGWLTPVGFTDGVQGATVSAALPPPSCINDCSALLGFIMRSVATPDEVRDLKLAELISVWAYLVADWHSWEEMEDQAIFIAIKEAIDFHQRLDSGGFFMRRTPSWILNGSTSSIVECVSAFVTEAITAYPSAMWRACSCVHVLLNIPNFASDTEVVKRKISLGFAHSAFSRFKDISNKPSGLWKPLLLAISSCYISYPEIIEQALSENEDNGFAIWASGLARISSNSFDPGLSSESEIRLAVLTLTKGVERLLARSESGSTVLRDCLVSLMEACIHLKEVQQEEENDDDDDGDDAEDTGDEASEDEIDDEEDSEDDVREETEEEFLHRYAAAADELTEMVDEGDIEDEAQDIELGSLGEVDVEKVVFSLISHHQNLLQLQTLPPSLVQSILGAFPEFEQFFRVSC